MLKSLVGDSIGSGISFFLLSTDGNRVFFGVVGLKLAGREDSNAAGELGQPGINCDLSIDCLHDDVNTSELSDWWRLPLPRIGSRRARKLPLRPFSFPLTRDIARVCSLSCVASSLRSKVSDLSVPNLVICTLFFTLKASARRRSGLTTSGDGDLEDGLLSAESSYISDKVWPSVLLFSHELPLEVMDSILPVMLFDLLLLPGGCSSLDACSSPTMCRLLGSECEKSILCEMFVMMGDVVLLHSDGNCSIISVTRLLQLPLMLLIVAMLSAITATACCTDTLGVGPLGSGDITTSPSDSTSP